MRLASDKPPVVAWSTFFPEIKFKLTNLLERSQAGLDKRNPLIFDFSRRHRAISRYNQISVLEFILRLRFELAGFWKQCLFGYFCKYRLIWTHWFLNVNTPAANFLNSWLLELEYELRNCVSDNCNDGETIKSCIS